LDPITAQKIEGIKAQLKATKAYAKAHSKQLTIILALLLALNTAAVWLLDVHDIGTYGSAVPLIRISGHSMDPTLHDGELLTIYTPDKKPITVGSIITYKQQGIYGTGGYITHRVITINPDGSMVTKGDNNNETDQAMGIMIRNVTTKDVFGIIGAPLFG